MTWHNGPMCPFDTESTGVDTSADRIVSACAGRVGVPGEPPRLTTWLVNPGVPIPQGATAIHGITDEMALAGQPPAEALDALADDLCDAMRSGVPVVGWNVVFDLSLLRSELARHGLPSLETRLGRAIGPVVDGLLLDKQHDRYRRGGRRLGDVAAHFGVATDGAHSAEGDALCAARTVWKIANAYPALAAMSLDELHAAQITWAREQAASFISYLQSKNKPYDDVDGSWPIRIDPVAPASDELPPF